MKTIDVISNYLAIPDQDVVPVNQWVIEAMKQFKMYPFLQRESTIINIENRKGQLPEGIIRIAYVAKTDCNEIPHCEDCGEIINDSLVDCTCCNDTPADMAQHPTAIMGKQACRIKHQGIVYIYDYYALIHGTNSHFHLEFMKHRTMPFNRSECDECPDIMSECSHTYEITHQGEIITSFDQGCVCIDYYKLPTNYEGVILIFDHDTYIQAIAAYVMYKYHEREWNLQNEGAWSRMRYYLGRWQALKQKTIGEIGIELHDINAMTRAIYKDIDKVKRLRIWNDKPYYYSR